MVTLNFTFVVLLVMFLGFLWAMHRFVFKPVLQTMDGRDAHIVGDKAEAARASEEATALEDAYAQKIAALHRESNLRLMRARRTALDEHNARVDAFKHEAETAMRTLRKELRAEVDEQKQHIGPLAGQIAAAMASKLEME